ncbi:pyridoxal-phosphate dependent enzyme [Candidatus Dojkabacteria bacterium]|nr:pyridoxal-phosphate dependent enzyme [Candidatus Dojkabacteria bacterium]
MSIWYYKTLASKVEEKFRLTQGEGNTPIEQVLLKTPGFEQGMIIKLKREDLNPNGSFKDRSLAFQVSSYFQKGEKSLVISSSANSAISAVSYAKMAGICMHVFVSNRIKEGKMKRLELVAKHGDVDRRDENEVKAIIHTSYKPKSEALKFANDNKLVNLRGSLDDNALEGFRTLGYEIAKVADIVDAVFIPCSSGTSTAGLYKGLTEIKKKESIQIPQIHIVQTTKVHPIAKEFDRNFIRTEESRADAIVDRVAHRKDEIIEIIRSTEGNGWVISDSEIMDAKDALESEGISVSDTAALSVAGILKAVRSRCQFMAPLAIISGL